MIVQTAREFLANNGLAKADSRGKFSNDAKAFLTKAIESGIKFSDWDENGKIKLVPVRQPKAKDLRSAERMERNANVLVVKSDALGLTDGQLEQAGTPEAVEARRNDLIVRLKAKPYTKLVAVRKENAIKIIDNRGTVIVQAHCGESHPISSCVCKTPSPASFLNAVSFELIVSEHA